MSLFSILVSALSLTSLSFFRTASAFPVVNQPGTIKDLLITQNTTINATTPAGKAFAPDSQPSSYLNLALVNYLGSNNVKAYVTGLNANNQLVFVGPNGQFYYPSTSSSTPVAIPDASIAIPLGAKGSTKPVTIPGYISASRVYFSEGPLKFFVVATGGGPGLVEPAAVNPNDPNAATNWGFAELTWVGNGGLYADISFVDFVGLPLGITLTTKDGSAKQQALGLPSNAVQSVCTDLQNQAKADGRAWGQECVYTPSGKLIRVLAPIDLLSQKATAFSGYFVSYVKQVFQTYSTKPLTINTQSAAGLVKCHTNPSTMTMTCDGDNRAYTFPHTEDILGCNSGPFAIQAGDNAVHYAVVPRLCAAFNRGTLLLGTDTTVNVAGYGPASGAVQPGLSSKSYYTSTPYNWFSKSVHKHEWNGRGYAFSYDDVAPSDGQNVAGLVTSAAPDTLTLLVGGYDLA